MRHAGSRRGVRRAHPPPLGPRERVPLHRQPDRRQHGRSRKDDDASDPGSYLLLGAPTEKYPDGQMFAAVRKGKRYVSYHLSTVYLEPGQLGGISPELRRRMQGKTCFNVTQVDDALFVELDALTTRGRDLYAERGLLARN